MDIGRIRTRKPNSSSPMLHDGGHPDTDLIYAGRTEARLVARSIWIVSLFLIVTIGLGLSFPIDIVVGAQGVVKSTENTITLSAASSGRVLDVVRRSGETARKGEIVLRLEPLLGADDPAVLGELIQAERDRRVEVLGIIEWIRTLVPDRRQSLPLTASAEKRAIFVQWRLLDRKIADSELRLISERRSRDLVRKTAKSDEELLVRKEQLVADGVLPAATSFSIERQRSLISQSIEDANQRVNEAQYRRDLADGELNSYLLQLASRYDGEVRSLESKIGGLEISDARTAVSERMNVLVAPMDGEVEWLTEVKRNSAVQQGERLITITPVGGDLFVEATVPNSNGGRVAVGDKVKVIFPAVSEIRYGSVKGIVRSIAADSLQKGADDAEKVPRPPGYRVRIEFSSLPPVVRELIRRGMMCEVRIVTGRRVPFIYFVEEFFNRLGPPLSETR